jgi:transposase
VRWNARIVRAYYLKEAFQQSWTILDPSAAETHLLQWMRAAKRSRLQAFKLFVQLQESHLDGVLAWTRLRLSNGALEGMNNKIKLISHRSFGFHSAKNYIAAITSVVRQADQRVSSAARARLTFSTTSDALAVQTKGLGLSLCLSL